jgi:hypothetical protein
MKMILIILGCVLVLVLLWGSVMLYKMFYDVILESKDVQHLKVEEIKEGHIIKLKISGQPFYSGMVVRRINTKNEGSAIIVFVHMATIGLAKPEKSGIFEYELIIPEAVSEVRFGHNMSVIWRREKGALRGTR